MRHEKHSIGELTVDVCSLHNEPLALFGQKYYVGGSNGSNGNSGLSKNSAFGTIQAGITAQRAYSTGYGDLIYVAPGTYAESLTGDLEDVEIIGCGVSPYRVKIAPVDGHAYSGDLTNASFGNVTFCSASLTNKAYAAARVTQMLNSRVSHCFFEAKSNTLHSTAFRIGLESGIDTNADMTRSAFDHNRILLSGGNQTFDYGFVCGSSETYTYWAQRAMWNNSIAGNFIGAEKTGIKLHCHHFGGYGTFIVENTVVGDAAGHGNTFDPGIIFSSDGTLAHGMFVIGNRVSSKNDAISGFQVQNVYDNIVALGTSGDGSPAMELPVRT